MQGAIEIDGHYDDIAWLRFEAYDPSSAAAEEVGFGLRNSSQLPTFAWLVWSTGTRAVNCLLTSCGCLSESTLNYGRFWALRDGSRLDRTVAPV